MKKFVIFLLLPIFCFSQKEICKCTPKKKYDDSLRAYWKTHDFEFKTISKEEALKPVFDFVKIDFLYTPAKSSEIVDSLQLKIEQILPKTEGFDVNNFEKEMKIEDSIRKVEMSKLVGNIPKPMVIKSEKLSEKWVILYIDHQYDEMLAFGSGYWLSFSNDNGKTWKKYYTGLTENKNYYFKSNSKLPLWKDDNHLQIEADLVRMTQPRMHPMPPQYELVRDNALITLDLNAILEDSDNDGLSDIEERNLFLNPNSSDTDNDGILDGEDTNPRFKSEVNDITLLYEGIMFGNFPIEGDYGNEKFEINLDEWKNKMKSSEKSDNRKSFFEEYPFLETTKLLVTDDTNLQKISPKGSKIIILTKKEYEQYKKEYHSNLEQLHYGKLFKCDKEDAYILETSASYSGQTYKIIRTKKGWKVITVGGWIS